jgi:hypothetical protein
LPLWNLDGDVFQVVLGRVFDDDVVVVLHFGSFEVVKLQKAAKSFMEGMIRLKNG